MKHQKTLIRSGISSHKGILFGIACLIFLISLSLSAALAVWQNSAGYVRSEMERLDFGDITVWVSGQENIDPLAAQIGGLEEISQVGTQKLIFSEYKIGDHTSDSEGQLIVYTPENYAYRFFAEDCTSYAPAPQEIPDGVVYVSPSMISMFSVGMGDSITFPIARSGKDITLTVGGFYEDPFMGSSMIGMKGLLISEETWQKIAAMVQEAGHNALARTGYMLHITDTPGSGLTAAQLNILLNQQTQIQRVTEFTHSFDAIFGFMMTLQNVFIGLLLAFLAVLLLAAMVVLSHAIRNTIEMDFIDLGICKTMGYTTGDLRCVQSWQYALAILVGMVPGTILSAVISGLLSRLMVTTIGVLVPSGLPVLLCAGALGCILVLLLAFVWFKTGQIAQVSPIEVIRGRTAGEKTHPIYLPLSQKWLAASLALRQVTTHWHRYLGVCLVAVLLVFFASMLGRINDWLGPKGEGLMDAFNPADLHIAAQPLGRTTLTDIENTISQTTQITDSYLLGMPTVSINGMDVTANVITDPERFHILSGRTCTREQEIVLTEFLAADLGIAVGDPVTLGGRLGSAEFTVCGIYQCANDMGINLGMNREGYLLIDSEPPTLWCGHYFIADTAYQPALMEQLQTLYGGDVLLHENSWPGLAGILSAMKLVMYVMYGIIFLFILIVTKLTTNRLIQGEIHDLALYHTLGFTSSQLRLAFSLRFILVAIIGSTTGLVLSSIAADPLIGFIMRMEGISNFSAKPGLTAMVLPFCAVAASFFLFSYIESKSIVRKSF